MLSLAPVSWIPHPPKSREREEKLLGTISNSIRIRDIYMVSETISPPRSRLVREEVPESHSVASHRTSKGRRRPPNDDGLLLNASYKCSFKCSFSSSSTFSTSFLVFWPAESLIQLLGGIAHTEARPIPQALQPPGAT
jgi:hypothetical protein